MQRSALALVIALAASGCATDGKFVWVDELDREDLKPAPYLVMPGDRLVVNVWNQPPLSGEVLVRPDGNITLPLMGDVQVAGVTPQQAAEAVARKLAGLVTEPHVAVSLAGTREHQGVVALAAPSSSPRSLSVAPRLFHARAKSPRQRSASR